MSIQNYLEEMKTIQSNLLEFLDEEDNLEENFEKLISNLKNQKIGDDNYKLKPFLLLIVHISKNHYRTTNFFDKIERILQYLKDDLSKNFSNDEIFEIFKGSKRILLFLIQNNILKVDVSFVEKITTCKYIIKKYPEYFLPEIKPFVKESWLAKRKNEEEEEEEEEEAEEENKEEELPNDFDEKRKIGENDSFICKLIRNDSIEEFIIFVEKNDYSLNTKINPSIYETNSYLINRKLSLIKYAAFFGSCQIFKYLKLNGVDLKSSLWIYAVHSNNPEMIHLLEENKVEFKKGIQQQSLFESIKYHHIDITNYIQNNYSKNEEEDKKDENDILSEINNQSIKYYNFAFIQNIFNESSFCQFCKYDYYYIIKLFLNDYKIDVNAKQICCEQFK